MPAPLAVICLYCTRTDLFCVAVFTTVGGARTGPLEQRAFFPARVLGPGLAPAPPIRGAHRVRS